MKTIILLLSFLLFVTSFFSDFHTNKYTNTNNENSLKLINEYDLSSGQNELQFENKFNREVNISGSDQNYQNNENSQNFDSLSGLPDWEVVCDQLWSRYGDGISSGDLNGDGYDDVAVGAPAYDPGGAVFIYNGSATGPSLIPDRVIYGQNIGFGNRVDLKGDINNDGFNDLIIGDPFWFGGRVFVYNGSASGLSESADFYLRGRYYPNGFNFGYTVSSADVNGDGYSDVLVSIDNEIYFPSHNVTGYVYLGSSTGIDLLPDWITTLPLDSFDVTFSTISTAGDVNDDGFDDIVVKNRFANIAFIYFGSVNRPYMQPPDQVISNSSNIADSYASGAGDVNSDGFSDIFFSGNGGKVYSYYGSASGVSQFPDWVVNVESDCFGYIISSAGDFNNDGYDDFSVGGCESLIYVYFGSNLGLTNVPLILEGATSICLSFGDVNGDNISDILASYEPKAYGFFGSSDTISISPYIKEVTPDMNSVSVNKSSDIEIVFSQVMNSSSLNSSNVKVYAEYSGIIPAMLNYDQTLKKLSIDPQIDFRAGEKIDVTLTSGIMSNENISITPFTFSFITAATGGSAKFAITDSIEETGPVSIGDIDGDGDIDIIVDDVFTSFDRVMTYKNDGNGHFIYHRDEHANQSFTLADFDMDGDLDILSDAADNNVRLLRNDGLGNFEPTLMDTGGFVGKTGDLDGDGDPDIAKIISGYNVITAINENGTFIPQDIISVPVCVNDQYVFPYIDIADMDNDGDQDIVFFNYSFDEIWPLEHFQGCRMIDLLKNSGSGSFLNNIIYDHTFYESYPAMDKFSFKVLNYDNDNDIDILVSDRKATNNGNGDFSFNTIQDFYNKLVSADFDGDGDLDIVSSNFAQSIPRIFSLNDGNGNFTLDPDLNSDDLSNIIYTADFDGDGDIDLLTERNGKLRIASNEDCMISGPEFVNINSSPVRYSIDANFGYWSLSNYENTEASIISGINDDTVLIDPGANMGHFVLYYQTINTIFCSKHVYVDNPLPVELANFNSSVNGNSVTLNWTTASELNNSGYDIERSVKENEWKKAGAVNGRGTTISPVNYFFTDKNLSTGIYKYRLKQTDFNGNFKYFELPEKVNIGIPDKYDLSQNYPNPFNPLTTINYDQMRDGLIIIIIYDITGREVKTLLNEIKPAGYYKIQFNAADLSSGAYFYRMTAGDFVATKKMVVIK